ncbi:MAG TPA: diguanylate cyclase [Vicinamibacterales bacterium]|nr:diguanylate cyclase [Vicinamibacterales bacterium]
MKQWLANAPMRRKLTALMAATAAVALVLAGLALGGYEVMTFRRTLAQKLTTVAEIVGRNCTAALAFGDRSAARDVLNALQAEPAVRSGAVYDRDGHLFASFAASAGAARPSGALADGVGTRFERTTVIAVRPIVLDGERIGTVLIAAALDELWTRVFVFASVMLGIVVVCSLLAIALSAGLQRSITGPILDLASTARRIASDGDFARRAARAGHDEVGTLVDDFNHMLGEIQQQDRQLRVHQEQLESEVTSRTSQLVAANDRLTVSVRRAEFYAEQIGQLTAVGQLLQSCQTAAEVYGVVKHAMGKLFPSDSGALSVLNSSGNMLEAMTAWGDLSPARRVFAPEDCWAFRLGRPHVVSEPGSPLRCAHAAGLEAATTVCVPLTAQGESLGVLHFSFAATDADKGQAAGTADSTRGKMATAMAEQIALALANIRLREALRNQSILDQLTGLFNRRYLEGTLERECRRATRAGRPLSILMLDVDHFKRFNDMWGHDCGDTVLRDLATLMRTHFRGEDIACRYGGEEFVLLLPDSPAEGAMKRAEEFRIAVHNLAVQHRKQTVGSISVSIGVASLPQHGTSPAALLESADRALYQAKHLGRDRSICAEVVPRLTESLS